MTERARHVARAALALSTVSFALGCGLFDGADEGPPAPVQESEPAEPVEPVVVDHGPTGEPTPGPVVATEQGVTGPSTPCPDQPTPPSGAADVAVTWSEIRTATSGCFYFSGPGTLGRDDHLGDRARFEASATGATLAFGSARFEGTSAPNIRLARSSTHDFSGGWRVEETLEGQWVTATTRTYLDTPCVENPPRTIEATYRYRELAPGTTTAGPCTITAKVVLHFAPTGG